MKIQMKRHLGQSPKDPNHRSFCPHGDGVEQVSSIINSMSSPSPLQLQASNNGLSGDWPPSRNQSSITALD